jgi:transposase-like protein
LELGPLGGVMSNQHYPEEFKIQAVNQVTEKNFSGDP